MKNELRPIGFNEFIGQKHIVNSLKTFIKASEKRDKPVEHSLFYGQAGTGKTTIANLIADKRKVIVSSGAILKKPIDILTLFKNITENSVLFIDEIHALSKQARLAEVLYPAMEDFKIDIIIGDGANAQTQTMYLPPFTLIGATTNLDLLTSPLRSRFRNVFRLETYSIEDMKKIINLSAKKLNIDITDKAINIIAYASRIPRMANNLLKSTSDYAIVYNNRKVNEQIVIHTLDDLEIYPNGLTQPEVNMLSEMSKRYRNKPIGITTISQITNEPIGTIREIYEPYLLELDFIERTPQGRVVTNKIINFLKDKNVITRRNKTKTS